MRPDGHWQAGTRKHPFASCGHPWALMVPRKRREGCIARGTACGHRVASTPASEGKAHRFADRARPCALIEVRIRRRAPGMHREGRGPGSLRYRHRPGEPYSIAPMRGSLRALGVGVRREGPSLVRGRGGASGQGRMHVRHDRRRRGL